MATPNHAPMAVPQALTPAVRLSIDDLVGGNTVQLPELLAIYTELLPQYRHYLPVMCRRAQLPAGHDPRFVEHQWLVTVDGQTAGIMVFKYVLERRVGLLLDIAVRPPFRASAHCGTYRLTQTMINAALNQLGADAFNHNRPGPIGLAAEVESRRLVDTYQTYGFRDLSVEYYEPPTTPVLDALATTTAIDHPVFRPMVLGIFPAERTSSMVADPELITAIVSAFLMDHYALPPEHWAVHRALESIIGRNGQKG